MIEFRTLRQAELPAWYDHCEDVFQHAQRGYFQRHFECDPDANASLIFVAMDGEEIAASLRVFKRTAWLSGRAVAVGGIGEVGTKPAYRRQGLCSNLLQMSAEEMARRDIPVSILYGEKPLYAKNGWQFCPIRMTRAQADSLPPLPEGVEVRPYQEDDLPLLMGLYDLYAGRVNGAFLRSETYWQRWVLPQWQHPLVLRIEGRPLAYACARQSKDGKTLSVEELCVAPQAERYLPGLLRAVAEAKGCQSVTFLSRLAPEIEGAPYTIDNLLMVRQIFPLDGIENTEGLARAFGQSAGIIPTDMF